MSTITAHKQWSVPCLCTSQPWSLEQGPLTGVMTLFHIFCTWHRTWHITRAHFMVVDYNKSSCWVAQLEHWAMLTKLIVKPVPLNVSLSSLPQANFSITNYILNCPTSSSEWQWNSLASFHKLVLLTFLMPSVSLILAPWIHCWLLASSACLLITPHKNMVSKTF